MSDRATRATLIGLDLFLALTALVGGLRVVPTLPVEWLRGTPFRDYRIPATALTLVGVSAAVGAALLAFGRRLGASVSLLTGLAIAVFEVVQVMGMSRDIWLRAIARAIGRPAPAAASGMASEANGFPPALWLQPFYFALGLAMVALALRLGRVVRPSPQSQLPMSERGERA